MPAMSLFSTCLHRLACWWPPRSAMNHPSLKMLDLCPGMMKTSETLSLSSYSGKSVHHVLWNICSYLCKGLRKVIHHCRSVTELLNRKMFSCTRETVITTGKTKNGTLGVKDGPEHETWSSEIKMATIFDKTVNPQMKAMIQSDQQAVAEVLLSDWLECQSEEQDESYDGSDNETEWSEDWSDEGDVEMSSENRVLWESFLNNSDPYNPLHFSCPTEDKVKDSDSGDDEEEEPVLSCPQETDETEWSEEEDSDWSDEGDVEMSSENRVLWESFLNNSDPYNPLHCSCPTEDKVKASDSDHDDDDEEEEEEPVLSCPQETDETEWSEDEDSDWSDEGDVEMSAESRELWESFNSDPYNPLHCSSPTGVKIKASEIQQNHMHSSPTAREVEEHNPEQSTKERAKKVRFSDEVTVHNLETWDIASQTARDGSCWMELARDRERFKRRVEKTGQTVSPCLTSQHRARVLDRLLNQSDGILPSH